MTLQIKNQDLVELNGDRKVTAFYECIKDMIKRRSLSVLHLKDMGAYWNSELLECASPNVAFLDFKFPKTGEAAEEEFIQFNYKTLGMLKDGAVFNTNGSDTITIKYASSVIKEPYEYTSGEIQSMFESYSDTTPSSESITETLEMDIQSPLIKYVVTIMSRPNAFFYTLKNEATVLMDQPMVVYSGEDKVDADFYINCYVANRISNMLTYCDKIRLELGSNLSIKGFIGTDLVVINNSPVYEMDCDKYHLSDIETLLPKNPIKATVSVGELVNTFNDVSGNIKSFISDLEHFAYYKNGNGISLQFDGKEDSNDNSDARDSIAVMHVGDVENASEDLPFEDFKVYLPIKDIATFAGGNIPVTFENEDSFDTSFVARLSENSFIVTGKL